MNQKINKVFLVIGIITTFIISIIVSPFVTLHILEISFIQSLGASLCRSTNYGTICGIAVFSVILAFILLPGLYFTLRNKRSYYTVLIVTLYLGLNIGSYLFM